MSREQIPPLPFVLCSLFFCSPHSPFWPVRRLRGPWPLGGLHQRDDSVTRQTAKPPPLPRPAVAQISVWKNIRQLKLTYKNRIDIIFMPEISRFLGIIRAELIENYKIFVEFNNGIKGIIDFQKILEKDHREIIRELLDIELFKTVKVNLNTLCWDNEVDFAPDFLYEHIVT